MVLGIAAGGAFAGAAPRSGDEGGSQALEVALVVPTVVLLLTLLLHTALLGADLLAAQAVAREAARIAAVDDDPAVRKAAADAAGARPVLVTLDPVAALRRPGGSVTATVRLRSRAFEAFGANTWLSGRATMRIEDR